MADVRKRPRYKTVDGILFPEMFSPKCVRDALDYKPRDDDVIIDTYPKCGTTWTQNVVIQIFRKGRALDKPTDFLTASPFIDMLGLDGVSRMPHPGAIKTHIPYDKMPYSPRAKYIFVVRNPLDTCVSLYHHARMHPGFEYWDAEFDDFFELFMAGEVEYNDYFDHLLQWYPHRKDENVYYTTYETMKKDLKSVVLELAKFLGKQYVEAIERDSGVMNNILEHSSFQYMKQMFAQMYDTRKMGATEDTPEGLRYLAEHANKIKIPENFPELEFIRKGSVGGWRDYFSDEQFNRMKEKYEIKTAGTDIPDLWSGLFESK